MSLSSIVERHRPVDRVLSALIEWSRKMRENSPFVAALKAVDARLNQAREERVDDTTLLVTRFNPYRGVVVTRDLPIAPEQWDAYQGGAYIQHALGHLSEDDREFILTGLCGGDFEALLGPED